MDMYVCLCNSVCLEESVYDIYDVCEAVWLLCVVWCPLSMSMSHLREIPVFSLTTDAPSFLLSTVEEKNSWRIWFFGRKVYESYLSAKNTKQSINHAHAHTLSCKIKKLCARCAKAQNFVGGFMKTFITVLWCFRTDICFAKNWECQFLIFIRFTILTDFVSSFELYH